MAAGSSSYALLLWHGNTEIGLHFFDAEGAPLVLLPASWSEDGPLETSQSATLALLAGQGVLAFDGTGLTGTVHRFDLAVSATDGALMVTETRPGTGPEDTLAAYLARRLERQTDPVGAEEVHVAAPLAAVPSLASDGAPARLLLRSDDGGEVAFDQWLGPDRMDVDHSSARVSPDGTRLVAIRTTADSRVRLMVFDTASTVPVFEAPLPDDLRTNVVWLPDGRIAVLQDDGDAAARLLVVRVLSKILA